MKVTIVELHFTIKVRTCADHETALTTCIQVMIDDAQGTFAVDISGLQSRTK